MDNQKWAYLTSKRIYEELLKGLGYEHFSLADWDNEYPYMCYPDRKELIQDIKSIIMDEIEKYKRLKANQQIK
jgi:hypothetical protein